MRHIRLREHLDGNRSFRVCEGGWDSLCSEHPRDVSVTLQRDQTCRSRWLFLCQFHHHSDYNCFGCTKVGSPHQLPHLSFSSCVPWVQVSSLFTREPGARNSSCNRSGVGVCNRHSTLAFRGVVLTSSPGTAYSSHVKCLMRIWVGSHFPPSYKTN